MNKIEKAKISRYSKKLKAINYLGNKCICGEDNFFKLTFHHKSPDEKEFKYSGLWGSRWSILQKELDKCIILCQNCHREFHFNQNQPKDSSIRTDKKIYLEYKGTKCCKCGYNKCPAALTFHHKNPDDKEFWIGSLSERINSIFELSDMIKREIDKCDILCMNCHMMEHSDIEFYEKHKDAILKKIDTHKEIQPKIDRQIVKEMYFAGVKQKDIAKHFNASNGTISDIIKRFKTKNESKTTNKRKIPSRRF